MLLGLVLHALLPVRSEAGQAHNQAMLRNLSRRQTPRALQCYCVAAAIQYPHPRAGGSAWAATRGAMPPAKHQSLCLLQSINHLPDLSCGPVQVVSYADLKKCVGGAFGELQMASRASIPGGFPMGMGGYPRPPVHY